MPLTVLGQADMIVTAVQMSPPAPAAGQAVTFSATIKNQGTTATPAGVKNGVVFSVGGSVKSWSDNNTQSIPPGGSVTVTANGGPAGSATWTAVSGAQSVDAWVNDAQRYPESNFNNNHLVTTMTISSSITDMIVTGITMSPANPVAGQAVTFSATIKNQGTKATPGTVRNGVVFSIDGTVVTWSDNNTAVIPAGGSVTVTANGGPSGSATWAATAGSHTIDAWVNDAQVYPESNFANNHLLQALTVPTGYIDMIVTGVSMSPANPTTGQAVTFSATIKNQGTIATPAGVKNGVVFSIDGATATWSDNNTSSIPAGGSVTVTANSGPTGSATWTATTGTHNLDAWVNDAQRYPESSFSNNHLITSFTVANPSIDMIVTAISMSPAAPAAGQAVTFSATIKNQGTTATPAGVKNGVVFSIDGATVSWSDNNTSSIAPGASVTVTANGGPSGSATWTAVGGSHSLDAWVNDAQRYQESTFSNNHLVQTINVTGGTPGPYGQTASQYTLTFSDEFNGTSLDTSKWNDHIWYEASHPTINYAVENGVLKIWPVSPFVDRTIDTDGKFSQTYGYYEAEMKLNYGKGLWPAFWLYAHPADARPEIDIMEAYPGGGPSSGWGDSNLHPINYGMTLHRANADYSFHQVPYATKYTDFKPALDLSAAFHKYAVKWTSTSITFYFDGAQIGPTYNYSDSYYNRPMYVLFDLWFGSVSGTPDGTTPTGKANSFQINYVRVWRQN
jgi:hypothetical protein